MSHLPGTWDLALKTPIGPLRVEYRFEITDEGMIRGTAASTKESVPLANITIRPAPNDAGDRGGGGEHVTWQQKVTKPMRLNLDFDVFVNGDTMIGHSRAGRLPRSAVTGQRK